ncbi:hypothetical protein B0H11DRAFT_2236859 [Mycena galericulata]|nr:hypothetical protein B0H11DRAFT_2236859 [Mycena galericulata]
MPSDSSENLHIEACVWRNWCGKKVGATTATVSACIESGLHDGGEAKLYAPVVVAADFFSVQYLSVAVSLVEWTLDGSSISLPLLLSASFLALPTLYAEVTARIVSEMAHGLFHALLPFAAYEALTKGAPGVPAAAPAANAPNASRASSHSPSAPTSPTPSSSAAAGARSSASSAWGGSRPGLRDCPEATPRRAEGAAEALHAG